MVVNDKFEELVFLCGARDFHAIDWYRSALSIIDNKKISIVTDLIAGEGFEKLVTEKDDIHKLIILDSFLFPNQSRLGDLWRNVIKFVVMPFQVILLRNFSKTKPKAIYYAHSMYYIWLAWLAKIPFVGTPQGSDILVKPYRSRIYRWLSKKAMRAAKYITVDSEKMKNGVFEISEVQARIIQNGIDVDSIEREVKKNKEAERKKIVSIRGFTPLYRINDILKARNTSLILSDITLIYPFYDESYMNLSLLRPNDENMGSLSKTDLFCILNQTKLVFSIPISDSSPRSVYESIFCGAAVAISYNMYYESLPECMKSRIIILDFNNPGWFDDAINKANIIIKTSYTPSREALNLFDQRESFKKVAKLILS